MPTVNPLIALEVRDLCVIVGGSKILHDVNFAVPAGCYVGIVGPNGGGKTTLLRAILGLQRATCGSVSIFGQEPLAARKGGGIGYVPQRIAQGGIAFPVSVEELVWSGRTSVIGIGRRRSALDAQAVKEVMERTDVARFRGRIVGTLSGGERQRVFIARSLAAHPRLLILDEPTTGIDMAARDGFYALLKGLNADLGLTILFVSHDLEVMVSEAAFILALNQTIVCHCESHRFLAQDIVERLYGKGARARPPHLHL